MWKKVIAGVLTVSSLSCASAQVKEEHPLEARFDPSACVERFEADYEFMVKGVPIILSTYATVTYLHHDGTNAYYLTGAHVFEAPLQEPTIVDVIEMYGLAEKDLPSEGEEVDIHLAKSEFRVQKKSLELLAQNKEMDIALLRFAHEKESCPSLGKKARILEPIVAVGYGSGELHGTSGVIANPDSSLANFSVIPGHSGSGVFAQDGSALLGIISTREELGEYSRYVPADKIHAWLVSKGYGSLVR